MDLKQKANEFGFVSKIKLVHENLKSPDMGDLDKLLYYLWMCELQKWLREIHNIHIKLECFTDNTWDGVLIYENAPYEWDDKTAPVEAENCKTYEEALEICLQEALKLIKK